MLNFKHSHSKICYFAVLILFLNGCSSFTQQPSISPQIQYNDTSLKSIKTWKTRARITIHTNKKNLSGHLFWKHTEQNYHIQLSLALSLGKIIIKGDSHSVKVKTLYGSRTYSNPEQALLSHQLPPLPLHSLKYWMIGLPSPHETHQVHHIHDYHKHFSQQHHQVMIKQTMDSNGVTLPKHTTIMHDDYRVDITFHSWNIE
jgi:outer membrane lipoprotein LolB